MKYLSTLLSVVAVLAIQTCFCEGINGGGGQEVREVIVDFIDGEVIPTSDDKDAVLEYETLWSKAQYELVRQQFGLPSQDPTDTPKEAGKYLPERWINVLATGSSWLNGFLMHYKQDPVFKAGVAQNLSAMQAFVAFVSIGYAVVAMWLGPIQLTIWQRRSILVTYSAAGLVQAIFLTHSFGFVDIYFAYPSTLASALLFFIAFNLTNALLVLQSDDPDMETANPTQQIIQASSTRVITSLRAPCC